MVFRERYSRKFVREQSSLLVGPETGTSRGRRSASTAAGLGTLLGIASSHIGRGMTGREADKGKVNTVVCSSVTT